MRIAFVYDVLYPHTKGGVELRIHELSRRLALKGHEVHVFGLRYEGMQREFQADGIRYHCVMDAPKLYTSRGTRSIREAVAFAIALFPALLKQGRFDAIDCQNFPFFPVFSCRLASALTKSRLFVTWHEHWGKGYWKKYLGGIQGTIGSTVENLALSISPNTIAVSETTRNALEKAGKLGAAVVANGIDFEEIKRATPSKEKYDVVFAGRLIEDKHADIFLETVALLKKDFPKIKAAVVGDGPELEKLQALAKRLGVEKNVQFLGFANSRSELFGIFKSSKLFILPSTREGFGITLLEALACGLPAITTNAETNASRDLIRGGNGFTIGASATEFYEKSKLLLSNEALRKKYSLQAKKSAQKHSWDNAAKEFEKVIS